jgi:signal transduction histidine kinase
MSYLYDYIWIVVSLLVMGLVAYQLLRIPKTPKSDDVPVAKSDTDSIPYSKLTEIIETERNRIASELHDELGTLLSVIHLDLELVLRESSALTPHGEARLLEIRKNLNLVIESIRHNIWSLAPQMLDQVQLDFALRELCRKLDAYKGTHLHFVQSGISFPISHKQKLNLFRIVQELLTNAIKHSSAWNITVQLHWDDDTLTIIVEDDGSSYSRVDVNPSSGGMGTTNIIKRANLIGATMVKEELSRGMRVTIGLKKASQEQSVNTPIV